MARVEGKPHLTVDDSDPKACKVVATCQCGEQQELITTRTKILTWCGGSHVQNVWPNLTADEREMLISGTCAKCWKKLFGEE